MAVRDKKSRGGSTASRNPKAEKRALGGPPRQEQAYPGSEKKLRPAADHGEKSYRGSGKLKDLKALITGGDSGIGRAVAIAFAREGADVGIGYLSEHEDARETVRWIEQAGRSALSVAGDVGDREFCQELVQRAVDEFGGLDILVNNAAFQWEEREFEKISPEQLEHTFRTNVFGYFWIAQAAVEHMREGAAIINTGSVTAMEGNAGLIDYAASKGAIHAFTKSLAQALAKQAIRVNCVAPGPVWTPLIPATFSAEHLEKFGGDTVWGRPAQPAELAPTYVFLASADSRYYTGEIFSPTGRVSSR
jgi:NAD(P)-dependent dehydrogenase (short-subunit alcohol dehydrogenase family)